MKNLLKMLIYYRVNSAFLVNFCLVSTTLITL